MPNDFEQVAADAARNAASAEQVVRNLITKSKQNETFTDAVMGFVSAVDWSEHWLWALGAWHVLMLLLVLATRHEWNLQAGLLTLICSSFYNIYFLFVEFRRVILFFILLVFLQWRCATLLKH
jgi:hypothetical protein